MVSPNTMLKEWIVEKMLKVVYGLHNKKIGDGEHNHESLYISCISNSIIIDKKAGKGELVW